MSFSSERLFHAMAQRRKEGAKKGICGYAA
jgi:hypothetical protein